MRIAGRQPILTASRVRLCFREAIVRAHRTRPFRIDAWVLLPDHLHCIWTLPPEDGDFSSRWGFIKRFVSQPCKDTMGVATEKLSASKRRRKETGFGNGGFGNMPFVTPKISTGMWIISIGTP